LRAVRAATPNRQLAAEARGRMAAPHGSVTLQIAGPLEPGSTGALPLFEYAIRGGTRRYRHASGGGQAVLTETSAVVGGCPPPRLCPAFFIPGQFTLTLLADETVHGLRVGYSG
jgi:hypothetical protein